MEHCYDGPTNVPNYKKKIYRTDPMGFLNHEGILRNFTVKYGLPLPQYIVYPDQKSKTKSFNLAEVNTNKTEISIMEKFM